MWMRTIPDCGLLRYLGIVNIERIFLTTPEVLKGVLHTKSYGFIGPPLVTNDIGRVLGRTGCYSLRLRTTSGGKVSSAGFPASAY